MKYLLLIAGSVCLALIGSSQAQGQQTVRVVRVESPRSCSYFESYWGWWLVIECRNNFRELGTRIESALIETGMFRSSPDGASDLRISVLVNELGLSSANSSDDDSSHAERRAAGMMDIRARDGGGNDIYSGTVTASVEIASSSYVSGDSSSSGMSPRLIYDRVQRELALAAARAISFRLVPARVISATGETIQINYGAPLLRSGSLVLVQSERSAPARYRVRSVFGSTATAERERGSEVAKPGALVSVVEADDPAQNGRRYQRVDLPMR
jgi:hypothetical protein